jgi:hypothetical protein
VSAGLHTVHVRVNDAATGQPTPVRIRFVDSAGQYLAPFGRLTDFFTDLRCFDGGGNVQLGLEKACYIDGSCEIALPADTFTVEVCKGPEYHPLRRTVALGPGKLTLRLALERWIDLRKERWYSGDSRAHFLPPHTALLEGAAEDLAVVNLLAVQELYAEDEERGLPFISGITAFSGRRPALETPGHLVVVNTSNWHPHLGALGLLNCHRVVYPLVFGNDPEELNDWTLADWCDQCHRKAGLVVWGDFEHRHSDYDANALATEALADLLLGKVDAVEFTGLIWKEFPALSEWYRLLDCGLQVPLVGGSGKVSNMIALGSVRTYARLGPGEEFTYKNWIEAVRAGRTFITNGPLLSLSVNGEELGSVIDLPEAGQAVHVRAEARSLLPFERLEVVFGGTPVCGTATLEDAPTTVAIEADVVISASGWLAARCGGPHRLYSGDGAQTVAAHTSPIYVRVAGQPIRPDPDTATPLFRLLDNTSQWVEKEACFTDEKQRERLAGIFQAARNVLAKKERG